VDQLTSIGIGCCEAHNPLQLSIKRQEGDLLNSNPRAPLYGQSREAICMAALEAAGNHGGGRKKDLPITCQRKVTLMAR
jgi:hypothetical protein